MIAVAVVLLACADGGLGSDYRAAHDRANAFLAANPDLAPMTANAIRALDLHQGMSMPQVVAAWGRPALVERYRGGAVQFWYFGCGWPHHCTDPDHRFPAPDEIYQSHALFQDGRLVEWQG
jgi:hypothetical protein